MAIQNFGRMVFREKDMTFTNVDTKEKVTKKVLFSNMIESDLPAMQEIHDRVWESDKYPDLGLTMEQFQSYYENCREFSIAAVVLDEQNPENSVRVGGICAMPIEMITIAGNWNPVEGDDYPLTWNECTNYGYFDMKNLKGDSKRIWPNKNGSSIICPTVFVRPIVKIGDGSYRTGSLMKEIILSVDQIAKERCEAEKRKIRIYAYSTPKSYSYWYNDFMDRHGTELPVNDYLIMSSMSKNLDTEWRNCLEAAGLKRDASPEEIQKKMAKIKSVVKDRKAEIYLAYRQSGGDLPIQTFEERDIFLSYSVLPPGRAAYLRFVNQFEIKSIRTFLHNTGRQSLDSVLGRHFAFGSDFRKIIPNGRKAPESKDFNALMKYPSKVPTVPVTAEVTNAETNAQDSTM